MTWEKTSSFDSDILLLSIMTLVYYSSLMMGAGSTTRMAIGKWYLTLESSSSSLIAPLQDALLVQTVALRFLSGRLAIYDTLIDKEPLRWQS